ncbi:MAG: hypothetical protein LBV67_12000 [Streptococcaceae bacterium]|jgi:hypothetical protein|nr:hypothetical protein [Streptococcaceae bacterium]
MYKQSEDISEIFINCYRIPQILRELWLNKNKFSKILLRALSAETGYQSNANYIIDFTSVFLIERKEDLLDCFCEIKTIDFRVSFMERFFNNDLVSNEIIFDILSDNDFVKSIGGYEEWIEYPIMLRAGIIIRSSENKLLDIADIIPSHLDLESYLRKSILSKAYNAKKLSIEAESYFKTQYS